MKTKKPSNDEINKWNKQQETEYKGCRIQGVHKTKKQASVEKRKASKLKKQNDGGKKYSTSVEMKQYAEIKT